MSTEYLGKTAYPEFVGEASDGHYARDVSRDLTELIEDLRTQAAAQGKTVKGKLTIELGFEVSDRGDVDFHYATKVKRPARPTVTGRMWIGKSGGLTAVHPRQLTIGDAMDKARRPDRAEERTPQAAKKSERRVATAQVTEAPEDDLSPTAEEE